MNKRHRHEINVTDLRMLVERFKGNLSQFLGGSPMPVFVDIFLENVMASNADIVNAVLSVITDLENELATAQDSQIDPATQAGITALGNIPAVAAKLAAGTVPPATNDSTGTTANTSAGGVSPVTGQASTQTGDGTGVTTGT